MNRKKKSLCCVPSCKGERFDLTHKFPRDNVRCYQWLSAIGCPKLQMTPPVKLSELCQVCSRHFRIEDYKHLKSRGLNKTAIPSLNLRDLSELHLSRYSLAPDDNKSLPTIIVQELIVKNPLDVKTGRHENLAALSDIYDNTEEDFGCVEMEELENLDEKLIADNCVEETPLNRNPIEKVEKEEEIEEKSDAFSPFIEVHHPSYENKLWLNSFWLRCHCRCSQCYDSTTRRKKFSPIDIPCGIKPTSVEQVDGMDILSIEWDDGHKSEHDISSLFSFQLNKQPRTFHRIPWQGNLHDIHEFMPFEFKELLSCDENIEMLFQNLKHYGVSVVECIPTQAMAKLVISRLFPHLEIVHFEKLNEIHSDVCSNLTYSSADCGLKCFYTTENTNIILVDGLNTTQELKAVNAVAFKTLSSVAVPLELSGSNVMWKQISPIVEIDPETEEILHLRLDVHRLDVLNTLPQDQVEGFYTSLREMIKIIQDKKNQCSLQLKPGTMVILDNWRVFHKCSGNAGISQCYLERRDFVSRMRYLGLI